METSTTTKPKLRICSRRKRFLAVSRFPRPLGIRIGLRTDFCLTPGNRDSGKYSRGANRRPSRSERCPRFVWASKVSDGARVNIHFRERQEGQRFGANPDRKSTRELQSLRHLV